jgi:hypothetical protein
MHAAGGRAGFPNVIQIFEMCDEDPGNDLTRVRGRNCEPQTSAESPRPNKSRPLRTRVESTLSRSLDFKGNVRPARPSSQVPILLWRVTATARENMRRLRHELWRQKSWLLRQNDAPFQHDCRPHSPWASDLAHCDLSPQSEDSAIWTQLRRLGQIRRWVSTPSHDRRARNAA